MSTANKHIVWYKHHIIPKHAGGTDDLSNIVRVNLAMHAFLHKCLYEEHGRQEDYIAYRALSGIIGKEEIVKEKQSLGATKNIGRKHTDIARKNMSEAAKKRKLTQKRIEVLKKNAELMKKNGHSKETKEKLKLIANDPIIKTKRIRFGADNGMFGKKHDVSVINKMSEKAKQRKRITCPDCNKTMDISNYKRWKHGLTCKEILNG